MKNYKYLLGTIMIIIGIISMILSSLFGGTQFRDFVSGVLFGIGVGVIIVGIIAIILSFKKGQ